MKTMISRRRVFCAAFKLACALGFIGSLTFPLACWAQDTSGIAVKSGEKIAFLGDSITQGGAATPSGYVRLVMSGLEANGVRATLIPAGVSGHTSKDMRARLEKDVLAKKPDWMTLSCGVNDVWHNPGVTLDDYKTNITDIVNRAQAAGIKPLLLTSTLIYEDPQHDLNKKAVAHNDFLRQLARERNLRIADLNADQRALLAAIPEARRKKGNHLTGDGVHMNPLGNQMMATGVLRAMGLSPAQLKTAQDSWQDIPQAASVGGRMNLTLRQYARLNEMAAERSMTVAQMLDELFRSGLESLLGASGK